MSAIHVFVSSIPESGMQGKYDTYLSDLPLAMLEKMNAYQRVPDRMSYLFGRMQLLKGLRFLGHRSLSLYDLNYSKYGKPFFREAPLDFNISHSGRFVVTVFDEEGKVGIDIEKKSKIDIREFVSVFTEEEILRVEESQDSMTEFFKVWTLKEAILKANGKGLSALPQKLSCIPAIDFGVVRFEGADWYTKELTIDEGYVAHVAMSSPRKIIKHSVNF